MTIQSGIGDRFYVAGYDLSGDVASIDTLSTPVALLDRTNITQAAMDRMTGLRDASFSFTTYFDAEEDGAHDVLSALPTTDVMALYTRGLGIGVPGLIVPTAKQIGYDPTRGQDGSLTMSVQVNAKRFAGAGDYPARWGEMITNGVWNPGSDGATDVAASISTAATGIGFYVAARRVDASDTGGHTITIEDRTLEGSGAFSTYVTIPFTNAELAAGTAIKYVEESSPTAALAYMRARHSAGGANDVDFLILAVDLADAD